MPERRRAVMCIALLLLVCGPALLGLEWQGHETSAGTWRDGVSLVRWGWLWALVLLAGALSSTWIDTPGARALTIVPLLAWFGWMLRAGALGPIPWLVYATPTVLAWWLGGLLGDVAHRGRHAP